MVEKKSPRLSFKGYKFSEALFRNKDSIKAIVSLLGGINFIAAFSSGFDWITLLITLGAGVVGLGVKLLSDAVDFYFGEVDL